MTDNEKIADLEQQLTSMREDRDREVRASNLLHRRVKELEKTLAIVNRDHGTRREVVKS